MRHEKRISMEKAKKRFIYNLILGIIGTGLMVFLIISMLATLF